MLISTMPLAVYQALGDAQATSAAYFAAGIVALIWGLMVPWATRLCRAAGPIPAVACYIWSAWAWPSWDRPGPCRWRCLQCHGHGHDLRLLQRLCAGLCRPREPRAQPVVQMAYAAAPWSIGPLLGVWLHDQWAPAPFLLAGGFALLLLAPSGCCGWATASRSSAPAARR
jgi:ACDE family multidrug resistance protein